MPETSHSHAHAHHAGDSHGHSHGHGHSHSHAGHQHDAATPRRLTIVLVLTAAYMVAEVVGGFYTHSLALLADAGHMLSDVAALGLSLFAAWLSSRPATPRHSYGYYRTEILAALANGATLVGISLVVFVEAARRFNAPPEVHGKPVMFIAFGGLIANVVGMMALHGGREANLNVRGAWLHLATDALGNVGALVAGGLVAFFGWYWADPLASILIGVLVIYSSWSLLRESVGVLMEVTPTHIDPDAVRDALCETQGVTTVHDLHVWSITSGMPALSAHVDIDGSRSEREVLPDLTRLLRDRFGIGHVTLQLETCCAAHEQLHA